MTVAIVTLLATCTIWAFWGALDPARWTGRHENRRDWHRDRWSR